jgi:hypothetical protein
MMCLLSRVLKQTKIPLQKFIVKLFYFYCYVAIVMSDTKLWDMEMRLIWSSKMPGHLLENLGLYMTTHIYEKEILTSLSYKITFSSWATVCPNVLLMVPKTRHLNNPRDETSFGLASLTHLNLSLYVCYVTSNGEAHHIGLKFLCHGVHLSKSHIFVLVNISI